MLRERAMNPIRSMLVHVDGTARCKARLEIARAWAASQGATLTGLFAANPPLTDLSYGTMGGVFPLRALQEQRARWRDAAKAAFDATFAGADLRVTWAELQQDPVLRAFAQQALYADLLVLGQHDPGDPLAQELPADFAQSVVIASGRPALVVPFAGSFEQVGRRVLVAWKATRESARAVTGALPVLQAAARVDLVMWSEAGLEPDADRRDAKLPGIESYLRSHGVQPVMHREGEAPREIGEVLLSRAADLDADLIVMGCYGHSRLREWVLGGVTHTLLRSMTVPVLMCH
jgi:nucleotide-binding universal stress UspA family protein